MRGTSNCLICEKSFDWERGNNRKIPMFCSVPCRSKYKPIFIGISNCEVCGSSFEWKKFRSKFKTRFCSYKCECIGSKKHQETCEACGEKFKLNKYELNIGRRFCSKKCANSSDKKKWSNNKNKIKLIENMSEEMKIERVKKSFSKNVIKQDGCWGWKGSLDKNKVGRVSCRIQYIGTQIAPRVSWIIHNGKIPKGLVVMHICDNPTCTNPDHLKLGTNAENSKDMICKGRQACGSKNANSKLNEEKVIHIKELILKKFSYIKIAKLFGVCSSSISNIKRGITWKHIPDPSSYPITE